MTISKTQLPVTVTVTGAAGNIGYATVFRIASGQLLGPDVPVRLNLLDIPQAQQALDGVAMELTDCGFSTLESVNTFTDPVKGFEGTNAALLIGARPRTQGMERSDLLAANGAIFSEQGSALNAGAADDVRVVVVGNPANTNALIASHHAPDIPVERFTALTRLDHNRTLGQLSLASGHPVAEIEDIAIWGNHSATQFPCIDHATIAGHPAREVLEKSGYGRDWVEGALVEKVAQRGAEIIRVRGGSSVGSAANAAIEHLRDWMTGQGVHTSMAVPTTGAYGIEKGIVCSFPVVCEKGSYAIREGLELSSSARAAFERSVAELLEEKAAVEALGLI